MRRFKKVSGHEYGTKVQFAARLDRDDFDTLASAAKEMNISMTEALRTVVGNWAKRKRKEGRLP